MKTDKVMIGTPMADSKCYHAYVAGLVETIRDLQKHNIDYDCHFLGGDSLIPRARNQIVDYFLKSDCTHLVFIDPEIYFPGDTVRKLLEVDKDFVCAPYPLTTMEWKNVHDVFWNIVTNKNTTKITLDDLDKLVSPYSVVPIDINNVPKPDENNCIKVDHSGAGFMLLSRAVFDTMSKVVTNHDYMVRKVKSHRNDEEYYLEYFKTGVEEGVYLPEDTKFCRDWRNSGGDIYLRTDIELDHIGSYMYKGYSNNILKTK
jgi:hypothetical protein